MSRECELAWAAGLFEGEGSITHTATSCLRLSLAMTDLDVIERFQKIAGIGSLGGWQGKPPRRYTHQWYADGEAASVWLQTMLPYLGERRTTRALELLERRDVHIAEATQPRECEWCQAVFSPSFSTSSRSRRFCTARCRELARNVRRAHQRKEVISCLGS